MPTKTKPIDQAVRRPAREAPLDGQVHAAAVNMGEAAAQGVGEAVIDAFAKVQQGCLGCHRSFRTRFVQHFHQQG